MTQKDEAGNVLAAAGSDVSDELIEKLFRQVKDVRVRSVLTLSPLLVCVHCATVDGFERAGGHGGGCWYYCGSVDWGASTQLTMRTFHTGGCGFG